MFLFLFLACCLVAKLYPTLCNPWTIVLWPWYFPGKNTGVVCRFLLQGIFLTQELNPCLLSSPALAGEFFTTGLPRKPQINCYICEISYLLLTRAVAGNAVAIADKHTVHTFAQDFAESRRILLCKIDKSTFQIVLLMWFSEVKESTASFASIWVSANSVFLGITVAA